MFLLRNLKENCLPSSSSSSNEKELILSDNNKYSDRSIEELDKKQIDLLKDWLDDLNEDKLIEITNDNNIIIMAGGINDKSQEIFVHSKDIDYFMLNKNKNNQIEIISMLDLSEILLLFNYVYESSGQLLFNSNINNNQYKWLLSIIKHFKYDHKSKLTSIYLFDGFNNQTISIPYEYIKPTDNIHLIANYLYENGQIQYDEENKRYIYYYIKSNLLLKTNDYEYLSFNIINIYIDKIFKIIKLEFRYEKNNYLILPSNWYDNILLHQFNKDYIIQLLISNGGIINKNKFIFMGNIYSLEDKQINSVFYLSSNEKYNLICEFIDLIIKNNGTIYDNLNNLFILENSFDNNNKIYFNKQDSLFIKENKFKKENVIQILNKYSQIKKDLNKKLYLLFYNNQILIIPFNQIKLFDRYHNIIDYMYRNNLITFDKTSQLIKLHFSDQILSLPINHLHSIISKTSSNQNNNLPFTSKQLSQWLINNSYLTRTNI